ncbi:MAG: hypothetical protein GDA53_02520 [Rhodobacteraceae bacterium]|nr:hypothetical protein [Paracoccaceae bacterium]
MPNGVESGAALFLCISVLGFAVLARQITPASAQPLRISVLGFAVLARQITPASAQPLRISVLGFAVLARLILRTAFCSDGGAGFWREYLRAEGGSLLFCGRS